ncbi:MAG: Dna2/Cas4 domain-containing protein [Chloroflexi bacterium]|nr:Dna2/Cas4 domain-containing protein [Chloroflexota bacterium]
MAVTVGLALLLLALLALVWAVRLRAASGLPWAPVVYHDTGSWVPERPLIARRLGLAGKPDYLMRVHGRIVPVEVKPGRNAPRPYESDLAQLAAYCVLVEETTGVAPPYGLLRYAGRTFRMNYGAHVRNEVLALLEEMRDAHGDECDRSHDDAFRCRGCGFFEQCDQAMT